MNGVQPPVHHKLMEGHLGPNKRKRAWKSPTMEPPSHPDPYFQSQIHTNATSHVYWAIPLWYLSAFVNGKPYFESQIHTNAT